VANEETWDKNFNWFDEEHYERFEVVAGSREALLKAFHDVNLVTHPYRQYGTCLKDIREEENLWKATVSRFKTKELCAKHCVFPPRYVRTGEMVP
jgi:hypothetical protein